MKTIWKYPISPDSVSGRAFKISILAPSNSKPICVMNQNGIVCVWVEVDPDEKKNDVLDLYCVGTGHGAVPEEKRYFGSVIDGQFVWHFYL